MMCPNDNTLPRWLCMEPECEAAERKHGTAGLLAGIEPMQSKELEPIPDWPTNRKHPMFTLNGITYMLEYDTVFYSVIGSWNAEDGDMKYQ